jgi:hypothetical protein
MFQVDRATVEALNRIAQRQPLRLAALLAATYLLVIPIVILLGLVVAALRRPTPGAGRPQRGRRRRPARPEPARRAPALPLRPH